MSKKSDFQYKLDRHNITIEEREDYKIHEDKYWFVCNVCGYAWKHTIRLDRNMSCPNCYPSNFGKSKGELELYDLLLTSGEEVVNGNRTILNGKELDIYFPKYKFAIEYNGKFWHNKEEDLIKNQLCKEKGITLYRIDDFDWNKDREPILNEIKQIFKTSYNTNLNIYPEKVPFVIRINQRSKKVICTDTMEIFESAIHASYHFKIFVNEIRSVCNGNMNHTHGYHFKYYKEGETYEKTEVGYNYHCIRLKCIETGEVFNSISDAVKILPSVRDVIDGKQKTAGGFHWKIVEENPTNTTETENAIKKYLETYTRKKEVICLDDNKIFPSMLEAADYYNINVVGIASCCRGYLGKTAGKSFQYVNDPHPFIPKEITLKKVYCSDLNITFNSLEEAANYFHAPLKEHIARVCRGVRKSYKGHKLEYINGPDITYIPVIIMETEEEFSSLDECATYLETTKVAVRNACVGKWHYVSGFHVCYLKDYNKETNIWLDKPRSKSLLDLERSNRGYQVIIMETEQSFATILDCAKYLEVSDGVLSDNIRGYSKTCKGYHICYLKDYDKNNNPWLGKERYSDCKGAIRPIQCIETNETFNNIKSAAKKLEIDYITFLRHFRSNKPINNLHFKFKE